MVVVPTAVRPLSGRCGAGHWHFKLAPASASKDVAMIVGFFHGAPNLHRSQRIRCVRALPVGVPNAHVQKVEKAG